MIIFDRDDAVLVAEEIRDAALPDSGDQLVGVVIGEATAGFISGLASRVVAKILKDEKRDNEKIKIITTGTYFGARGFIRGVAQLAGVPRPIARILASIGATAFSESAKVAARATEEAKETESIDVDDSSNKKKDRKKLSSLSSPMKKESNNKTLYGIKTITKTKETENITEEKTEKKPLISASEITGDVTKWVLYDLLLPTTKTMNAPLIEMVGASAEVGAVAGLGGKLISVLIERSEKKKVDDNESTKKTKSLNTQLIFAVIEGATLFAAYAGSVSLLDYDILPTTPVFIQQIIENEWF